MENISEEENKAFSIYRIMESTTTVAIYAYINKFQVKQMHNLSKIWPLDFDFPADFFKYWKI